MIDNALIFYAVGDGWNAMQPDGEYVGCVLPCHPQVMPLYQARLRDPENNRDELCGSKFYHTADEAKRALVRFYSERFPEPKRASPWTP